MSLLLDARKKSQQAQSTREFNHVLQTSEFSLEEHSNPVAPESDTYPIENARSTGQNLFAAKSLPSPAGSTLPNRNLLLVLGGTILLLALGAGYFWYLDSASNTTPLRPASARLAAPATQPQPSPAAAETRPQHTDVTTDRATSHLTNPAKNAGQVIGYSHSTDGTTSHSTRSANNTDQVAGYLVAGIAAPSAADGMQQTQLPRVALPVANEPAPPRKISPIRIEQQQTEPIDPLLDNAYLAYRSGKLDEAQQLYRKMLDKDPRKADALLGLAVIAQQRGENLMAAQYYSRVLALDPRNAVAHAGISALTTDDNSESRLKTLLREQKDSAALHFALGNLYAEQARWGEAQQAFFNAYMLESGNAEFTFNLAVSLDHLGQNKLAAQHYQRALQLDQPHRAGFDHAQIEQRVLELTR